MVMAVAHRYGTQGTTFSIRFLSKPTQQVERACPDSLLHWSNCESTLSMFGLPDSAFW